VDDVGVVDSVDEKEGALFLSIPPIKSTSSMNILQIGLLNNAWQGAFKSYRARPACSMLVFQ
jgi:hypothetical protein